MSPLTLYGGGRTLRGVWYMLLGIWYTLLFYCLCQLAGLFLLSLVGSLFSYFHSKHASLRCFIMTLSFAVEATLDRSRKDSWEEGFACL